MEGEIETNFRSENKNGDDTFRQSVGVQDYMIHIEVLLRGETVK